MKFDILDTGQASIPFRERISKPIYTGNSSGRLLSVFFAANKGALRRGDRRAYWGSISSMGGYFLLMVLTIILPYEPPMNQT